MTLKGKTTCFTLTGGRLAYGKSQSGIWKMGYEDAANGRVCMQRKDIQQVKDYDKVVADQ